MKLIFMLCNSCMHMIKESKSWLSDREECTCIYLEQHVEPVRYTKAQLETAILEFLKNWIAWVEQGAEEPHFVFNRSEGLCLLLTKYAMRSLLMNEPEIEGLQRLFKKMLGYEPVPFNTGDVPHYGYEKANGLMHTNPRRLMWAHRKIKELSK